MVLISSLYLQIMSCAKSYVFSTLQYVHIKCVAYGVVGQVLHNFWNSTDATVVLCVLQFWKIAWSVGYLQFEFLQTL